MTWTQEQLGVITAPISARQVVTAGPGSGKTAVALERIKHLVTVLEVPSSRILMLSFTRAAVAELKDRIAGEFLRDPRTRGVRISTIDSEAWHLRHGFEEGSAAPSFKGYDENIEQFLDRLRDEELGGDVREYLARFRQIIVDEAQDLYSIRAELIREILSIVPEECGFVVFGDSAQAIFEFAEDGRSDDMDGDTNPSSLIEQLIDEGYVPVDLVKNHRTENESLLKIARECRVDALSSNETALQAVLEKIRSEVAEEKEKDLSGILTRAIRPPDLVLFRRRSEVVENSRVLSLGEGGAPVEHRIRMGNTPIGVRPWVARLFSDFTDDVIDKQNFEVRCERLEGDYNGNDSKEVLWEMLKRKAGDDRGRISMRALRFALSGKRPPFEFSTSELGTTGPILGTVHASKGREADQVLFELGGFWASGNENPGEEARVAFVGATRARKRMAFRNQTGFFSVQRLGSGRMFRKFQGKMMAIEIGREGDLDPESVASKQVQGGEKKCAELQEHLWKYRKTTLPAETVYESIGDRACHVVKGKDTRIRYGTLSKPVSDDMWAVTNFVAKEKNIWNAKPPQILQQVYIFGVTSQVFAPSDPKLGLLHEPYSSSGIYLSPYLKGMCGGSILGRGGDS